MKTNQRIKKYLLAALALFLLIPVSVFSIEGYSDVIEETSAVFSLPSEAVKGQVGIGLKGRTVTNLLGDAGNCEDIGKWSNVGSNSLNSTKKMFGTNSISFIPNGDKRYIYKEININTSKKYFVSAYSYIESFTSGEIGVFVSDDWSPQYIATLDTSLLGNWQHFGIKVDGSVFTQPIKRILVGSAYNISNTNYNIDGIMVNEITQDEYNNSTVDELLEKYTYINDTKSTALEQRLLSRGKNAFNGDTYNFEDLINSGNQKIKVPANLPITWKDGLTPIKLKPNTQYTISSLNFTGYGRIAVTDVRDDNHRANLVGSAITKTLSSSTFTTTDTGIIYLNFCTDTNLSDLSEFEFSLMIEEGTTSTTYEEYQESISYIYAEDENGNILEAHLLSNGINDEVSDDKLIKRAQKTFIPKTGWISSPGWDTTSTYGYQLAIDTTAMVGGYNAGLIFEVGNDIYNSMTEFSIDTEGIYISSDNTIILRIDKNKIITTIDDYFSGKNPSLIYQLAQPEQHNLITTPVIGYPNGTVVVEPVVKGAAMYNDGIAIEDNNMPIEYIEGVSKLQNGIKTPVDINNVALIDKNSFTIDGAENGEIYEFIYKYPEELTTIPTINYSVPINLQGQVNGNVKITEMNNDVIQEIQNRIEVIEQQLGNVIDLQ